MKKRLLTTLLLSIALSATGCGKEESLPSTSPDSKSQESASGNPESSQEKDPSSGASADGQIRTNQTAPALTQEETLFANQYLSLDLGFPDSTEYIKRVLADSYGNSFYLLASYQEIEDETALWQNTLYRVDGDTKQSEQLPFTLELPDKPNTAILSMEVKGENELSFRINDLSGEDSHDLLAITDMEGNLLSLEENFPDSKSYPWNPDYMEERIVYDAQDSNTLLCEWDDDTRTSSLFWYDKENQSRKPLGTLDGENISSIYLADSSTLYYTAGGGLILWDMAGNTRQKVCRISDIGVPAEAHYTGLLRNSAGEVLICSVVNAKTSLFVLSEEQLQSVEEIRFAYIQDDLPRYSVKLASTYSYEHPDTLIKREGPNGEDFRNRIFMELAAGNGPELLWLSKEDMEVLAEKDVLMDLKELIPEDIYAQLFPCLIQDGSVDGKMVGLAPGFEMETMAVPNVVWQEDSWTLSDLLSVAESRDDWELIVGNPYKLDGYRLFFKLLPGLTDTPFLDLEQGKANFDHEDFRRLLELCLQYGGKTRSSDEEIYTGNEEVDRLMREGTCMTQLCYINRGFLDFSATLAAFQDEIHMIGFPSYENSGHYISSVNGYLAVNKNAAHLDEIREYISLFLDYDQQILVSGYSARRDVEQAKVIEDGYLGQPMLLIKGLLSDELIQQEIELKPDGTTYLEESMAILDSAVPWPEHASQISAILKEEVGAYFAQTKNLEDTINVIQNRVQLYLDER